MVSPAANRLFHIPAAVFTGIAVMVNFCLVALPEAAEFAVEKPGGGTVESFIPSPAEEPALLLKTEDPRFSSPWTEFQRIFKARGNQGGPFASYRPVWGISSSTGYINLKNSILLKLRI
jgi:hypothetical protein